MRNRLVVIREKERRRRYLAATVAVLLCIFFYWQSVAAWGKLSVFDLLVTIVSSQSIQFKDQDVQKTREKEERSDTPLSFAFWSSGGNVSLSTVDTMANADAELLVVNGRTDLLFPSSTWMDVEDSDGCLIGRSTAIALYGTSEVTGLSLTYNGKSYIIRGIIKEAANTIVIESSALPEEGMDTATVRTDETVTLSSLSEQVVNQLDFTGEPLDYRSLNEIAHFLTLLLPFLVGVFLLRFLYGEIRQVRKNRPVNLGMEGYHVNLDSTYLENLALWWGIFAVAFLILAFMLMRNLSISQDMIPTKWSDFDFWSTFLSRKRESFFLLLRCEKRQPELYYVGLWRSSVGYSILTLTTYVYVRILIRPFKLNEL